MVPKIGHKIRQEMPKCLVALPLPRRSMASAAFILIGMMSPLFPVIPNLSEDDDNLKC